MTTLHPVPRFMLICEALYAAQHTSFWSMTIMGTVRA